MKTIIFANGEVENLDALSTILAESRFLIAADGGLRYIRKLGLIPNLVIGDMDSVSAEDLKWISKNQIEVRKFPIEKDQTDLELALLDAVELGGDPITVVGALGGRVDQTLANLYLLMMPELQNIDVCFDDGRDEVFIIQKHGEIRGKKGARVSLLPLLSAAKGVRTKGLRYPLRDEILFPERSRGISNEMKSGKAEVSLNSGLLYCFHSRL